MLMMLIYWEKKAEALVMASKEIGIEVNVDKPKYIAVSWDQNAGRSRSMKNDISSFERVEEFKCFRTNLIIQNSI